MGISKQVGMASALAVAATGGLLLSNQNKAQAAELNQDQNQNQQNNVTEANGQTQVQDHIITINHPEGTVAVWNGISNAKATGQELIHGSKYKVIREAIDPAGEKWFDLGQNQWIMARYTSEAVNKAQNAQTAAPAQKPTQSTQTSSQSAQASVNSNYSYNTVQNTQNYGNYNSQSQVHSNYNVGSNTQVNNAVNNNTNSYKQNSGYTSSVSGDEAAAKNWIAMRESGGSYTARNGRYIGKYQLDSSYLGGDYSAANQERVADNYVRGRYGSWVNAQRAWQAKGWY